MHRRTLLAGAAGTIPLAGCLGGFADEGRGGTPDLPEDCPKTQGLDVAWPDDLDAAAVESFAQEYEYRYYRDVVVEYEPESRLDSYELHTGVSEGPTASGDGFELQVSGGGGVYMPTLLMTAETADPPDGAEVVPASEIDDVGLSSLLRDAAASGEAELHVDDPGEEVEQYLELLASVSEEFERVAGPGHSASAYVAVEDATVELTVQATRFHGDYGWWAWYYVDEYVVRRTTEEDVDPRNGTLLECRRPD